MINAELRARIQGLAHENSQKEMCGLIYKEEIIIAENLANDRDNTFLIDPSVWIKYPNPDCIWHTHVNGKDLSVADIRSCKQIKIPFYLFELPYGKEYYYDPKEILPYTGRIWRNWISDCWTIIRDWYYLELGKELPDPERELYDAAGNFVWLNPDWDMYRQELSQFGFINVGIPSKLEQGDIILMNVRSPNPNHAAVYGETTNKILHHLYGRLSAWDIYGYEQRQLTDSVWRLQC